MLLRNGIKSTVKLLARLLGKLGGPVSVTLTFLTTSTVCAFVPPLATWSLGVASMASTIALQPKPSSCSLIRRPGHPLLRPLGPLGILRGHFLTLGLLRVTLPMLLPGVWRAMQYWQRSLPIMVQYLRTNFRAQRLIKRGRGVEAERLWSDQHQAGADQVFDMLADIKGFYLKLAQILASKTDMLPPVYTQSLGRLMDRLPPAPWSHVKRALKSLGRPIEDVFEYIDVFPLASATVAQVHEGRLLDPQGLRGQGVRVAVKVQHKGARRMMGADLANMRLFVELCDLAQWDLGFDLGSVVREYQVVVPNEFRFDKEADAIISVQESLMCRAARDLPELKRVILPSVITDLSSARVLVMTLLEGVPLLHATALDTQTKHDLMHALIMAFGVQILSDGFFHTDPHGGNLMACRGRDGEVAVGLLDFGQVKRLSGSERLRYARLIVALASRDGSKVRTTARQLGIQIENCGEEFEEIAAYILFDTRMDIPEAWQSPMDPDAHEGWRTTRLPRLPRDLFMIMRVITLLRGVMASMQLHDVSSALLWKPLADKVIEDLDPTPALSTPPSSVRTPAQHRHAAVSLHSHPVCGLRSFEPHLDPATAKRMQDAVRRAERAEHARAAQDAHQEATRTQRAVKRRVVEVAQARRIAEAAAAAADKAAAAAATEAGRAAAAVAAVQARQARAVAAEAEAVHAKAVAAAAAALCAAPVVQPRSRVVVVGNKGRRSSGSSCGGVRRRASDECGEGDVVEWLDDEDDDDVSLSHYGHGEGGGVLGGGRGSNPSSSWQLAVQDDLPPSSPTQPYLPAPTPQAWTKAPPPSQSHSQIQPPTTTNISNSTNVTHSQTASSPFPANTITSTSVGPPICPRSAAHSQTTAAHQTAQPSPFIAAAAQLAPWATSQHISSMQVMSEQRGKPTPQHMQPVAQQMPLSSTPPAHSQGGDVGVNRTAPVQSSSARGYGQGWEDVPLPASMLQDGLVVDDDCDDG